MSLDWYQDVWDFHEKVVGLKDKVNPQIPSPETVSLRYDLIAEEISETFRAMRNDDLEKIADGVADSIVVLIGTAIAYGIDLRPVWDEIHKTNMAKKDGPMRSDGKKLKPDGWIAPNIKSILEKQKG